LSPSHVRFGHFEFFHHSDRPEAVRRLADHVIAEHFPHLAQDEDRYAKWYAEVVQRTARLIAQWQAVGFAHGVMNTDNMSVLGLTIDYGPYGFMEAYEPGWICNHSDHMGRYAFDQQPAVALWNLQALALALTSLLSIEQLRPALQAYAPTFSQRWRELMREKLGLAEARDDDEAVITSLLDVMTKGKADYTLSFRRLSRIGDDTGRAAWLALFPDDARSEATAWVERYDARLAAEPPRPDRAAAMDRVNPKFVLRNWVAETAIRAVQNCGDTETLHRILTIMQSPFDEHPEAEEFAAPAPAAFRDLCVSCSS
jgi:uncharacterized protein YdiU (UPF0061 family)